MLYSIPKDLTYCSRVGSMSVRCHPFRNLADNGLGLLEKVLGCFPLSLLTHQLYCQVDNTVFLLRLYKSPTRII
jgi:hypothetical protein